MNGQWRGTVPYQEGLALQTELHGHVRVGGDDVILGLEHPLVVTLGVRGRADKDVMNGDLELPVFKTDRGGQATLHSPGQLVIYPIVDLRRRGLQAREFVHILLETTAQLYAEHGIDAHIREDRAGVYAPGGKIAFCGLRIDRGVSRHGLSLNISNDLSFFGAIRPCGLSEESLTSWRRFSEPPPMPELFGRWVELFTERIPAKIENEVFEADSWVRQRS